MKQHPKIGTIREDGMVFGGKAPKSKSGEWWTTPEKLKARLEKGKILRAAKYKESEIVIQAWRKANPEKVKEQRARSHEKRRKARKAFRQANPIHKLTPEEVRIRKNIRQRTTSGMKYHGWKKAKATKKLIGCTWDQLKSHLEAQFTEGMSWENYGKWHIDHIAPLASAKNATQLMLICHYTNLQPLWAADNIRKGAKHCESIRDAALATAIHSKAV